MGQIFSGEELVPGPPEAHSWILTYSVSVSNSNPSRFSVMVLTGPPPAESVPIPLVDPGEGGKPLLCLQPQDTFVH